MNSGDRVEVTNDSNWESNWVLVKFSNGMYICSHYITGEITNWKFAKPQYTDYASSGKWTLENVS